MQAVVLMAGKGTRMAKYYDGPKQLLPVAGKPVVEHALNQLPPEVTDLIFVVGGPHEEKIRHHFRSGAYKGKGITFVVQSEQLGLAHAFRCVRDVVRGKWLGIVGDDIYGPRGLRQLLLYDLAVLAAHIKNPETFGVLVTDREGYLLRSVEKPREFISDLVWTGAMVMDERFFKVDTHPSGRGEYETPDVWMEMITKLHVKIQVVESELWLPVNDKAQLGEAERVMPRTYPNNT